METTAQRRGSMDDSFHLPNSPAMTIAMTMLHFNRCGGD